MSNVLLQIGILVYNSIVFYLFAQLVYKINRSSSNKLKIKSISSVLKLHLFAI